MSDERIKIDYSEIQSSPVQKTHISPSVSGGTKNGNQDKRRLMYTVSGLCTLVVAIIGISSFLWHASSREHRQQIIANIERVIAYDKSLSDATKTTEEDSLDTVRSYVMALRQIDFSGCPDDFRQAYLRHIHAWDKTIPVLELAKHHKMESESIGAFIEGFLRGLVFDFGMIEEDKQARNAVMERIQSAQKAVQDTWHRVEEIAVHYGAQVAK
jgi:hypothetical protein